MTTQTEFRPGDRVRITATNETGYVIEVWYNGTVFVAPSPTDTVGRSFSESELEKVVEVEL